MIVDKISNWRLYFKNPVFETIFDQLKDYSINTDNGIYQNHPDFYFKVMDYTTTFTPNIVESHLKEVDIQIILSGEEKIKIFDHTNTAIKEEYDSEKDCIFYKVTGDPHSEIVLKENYMGVFFPADIHHPQFCISSPLKIKKIVIKVNEKLFA